MGMHGRNALEGVLPTQLTRFLVLLAILADILVIFTTPAAAGVTELWHSPKCQDFYARSAPPPGEAAQSRSSLPRTVVKEDFHYFGRAASAHQQRWAEVVHISHEYKIVYIQMRKAASSTLRLDLMKPHLNASQYDQHCPAGAPKACRDLRKCTSFCLTPEIIETYFFFTFVRHPLSRFPSSLEQSLKFFQFSDFGPQHKTRPAISEQLMEGILEEYIETHRVPNVHMQSQAFSLSTPTSLGYFLQFRVPLDFVGRVENLAEDLQELQGLLEKHTQAKFALDFSSIADTSLNKGGRVKSDLSPRIQELVRKAYEQDFVCFGYEDM